MSIPLRVLLVEDSIADAELTLIELRHGGYEPIYEQVDTPEAMKAALEKGGWEIILSDYVMPRFSGPAALKLVQQMGIDIPFVVVTGQVGEATAIETLTAGAHDYIMKGNLARLIPAVQRVLQDAVLRRERREAEEALRQAHEELRLAHTELEQRVEERTAELSQANQQLQAEIAERKRAEHEREELLSDVEQQRLLFETVVKNAPAGIAVFRGHDLVFEVVNSVYQRFAPGKKMEGRTFAAVWPEIADELVPVLRKVLETGEPFQTVDTLVPVQRSPDGPLEDAYWTYTLLRLPPDHTGQPAVLNLAVETTADVRARRREKELASEAEQRAADAALERDRLRALVDSITDEVWFADTQRRITLVNPSALYEFDLASKGDVDVETLAMSLEVYRPDGSPRPVDEAPLSRALRGEVLQNLEEIIRTPASGQLRYRQVNAAPVRDANGNIIGSVSVVRDMTERKRAEEERERLLEQVQRHASELASANKELESFTYSVAHDLRSPVRHMDGFSRALMERYADKLDERGKQYLQFVRDGSVKMEQLIEDLLTLTGITRREFSRTNVDLSEMARLVVAELRKEQPNREVEFSFEQGIVVNGDQRMLRIVLENLLGNAWKFTAKREHAKIEFGMQEQEGKRVFYVRDNGAGFNPAYTDRLFRAFERLHSSNEFPGTGVGLATVERVIRRHGGRVWAEGEEDKGATFYFTLG